MKYKIEWAYKIKGQDPVSFTSDWMEQEIAILAGEDIEKTGKVAELKFL